MEKGNSERWGRKEKLSFFYHFHVLCIIPSIAWLILMMLKVASKIKVCVYIIIYLCVLYIIILYI